VPFLLDATRFDGAISGNLGCFEWAQPGNVSMVSWIAGMRILRSEIFRLSTAVAWIALGCAAQVGGLAQASIQSSASPQGQVVDGVRVREIHPLPPQSPFPITKQDANGANKTMPSLEFRAPGQMSQVDARMAENAQTAIAERAAHQGFDLWNKVGDQPGEWNYEQAVCPVFPDQLILEYSRDNGRGDISLLSVMIPRGNEGHVRVIPVRRRSYSLWTPTPTNSLTLNDFNHLVKENPNGLDPDWLTIGLCYAAMAGGHVRAALQAMTPAQEVYPLFVPAKLTIFSKTGAEVRFADITHYDVPKAKAMVWVMNFSQSGRLLKVKHTVAGEIVERQLPPAPEGKSWAVEGSVDLSKPAQ
jgi:hypothetical protein